MGAGRWRAPLRCGRRRPGSIDRFGAGLAKTGCPARARATVPFPQTGDPTPNPSRLPACALSAMTRRRNDAPGRGPQRCRLGDTLAHTSKPWRGISQRHRSVSMTQRSISVDERIAAMRSRIAEQLLHIQRLNVLGRGTSDACEVLDLMLSALAQMKEVKKTIRALERAS